MPPYTQPETPPSTPPNDLTDIFSASPPDSDAQILGGAAAPAYSRPQNEVSDVARLRSIHVTNGYREGVSVAKEQFLQEWFDEGYAEGAEIGLRVGRVFGALEGLMAALLGSGTAEDREEALVMEGQRVKRLLAEARLELDIRKLFVQVEEGEGQGEVTVKRELIERWENLAKEELQKWGIHAHYDVVDGEQAGS